MTKLFITRHDDAREWARRLGIDVEFRSHLDNADGIGPGDTVMGILPVHLIAKIIQNRARYIHLEMELPEGDRGLSLSADEMSVRKARLIEYHVYRGHHWRADEPIALPSSTSLVGKLIETPQSWLKERWQRVSHNIRRAGLLAIFLGLAFVGAVSLHLAAEAGKEIIAHLVLPTPGGHEWHWRPILITLASASLFFVLAAWLLYRNRHRVIEHGARIISDPEESARKVLIMGLSDPAQEEPLLDFIKARGIPLSRLMLPASALRHDEALAPYAAVLRNARWMQNLRAIWYHKNAVEWVQVIVSGESNKARAVFEALFDTACAAAEELGTRKPKLTFSAPVSFDKYDDVQGQVDKMIRDALKGGKYKNSDICVDVTAGLKPFSVAAAASTFGPDRHFMYVNNDGVAQSYNAKMRWAEDIHVE